MSTSPIYKLYISSVLTCEYPLPDPEFQDYVFQTKAFDGLLDRYSITRDGRLILHAVAQEFVSPEERPNYGTPEWNSPWGPWEGAFRPVPVGDVEIPFDGYFEFSTDITNHGATQRVVYRATFSRGRLQEIVRVQPPSPK
jgi:hypothetical protein